MRSRSPAFLPLLTMAALLCAPAPSSAVYLDRNGFGQALIFPFFTVQGPPSSAFNTYVSVVNSKSDTKVVKVRFREGKNSHSVAEFNLYLAPNDMWAAAIVRDGDGARLVTRDVSCTNPPIAAAGLPFSNAAYASGDDGEGTGLDRTREGHIDVIEMGTLSGAAAAAVVPADGQAGACSVVQGTAPALGTIGAPTGGLSGNATLINVINGFDSAYKADALGGLTSAPLYSHPGQPGTDFDAPQVTPVSFMTQATVSYKMQWDRGVDAVSAVLMAVPIFNEFVLEPATRSQTDWVVTFPTRRFYVTKVGARAPFSAPFGHQAVNCEGVENNAFNREGQLSSPGVGWVPPASGIRVCWSSNIFSIRRAGSDPVMRASDVFASQNVLLNGALLVPSSYNAGRISLRILTAYTMDSLPSSVAVDMQTGTTVQSSFRIFGLPVTGFMARTFENGTLTCGGSTCQGNYASAFPHDKTVVIERLF
jgi:hypothetical protein